MFIRDLKDLSDRDRASYHSAQIEILMAWADRFTGLVRKARAHVIVAVILGAAAFYLGGLWWSAPFGIWALCAATVSYVARAAEQGFDRDIATIRALLQEVIHSGDFTDLKAALFDLQQQRRK